MADRSTTDVEVDPSGQRLQVDDAGKGIVHPTQKDGRGNRITDLLIELGYASHSQIEEAVAEAGGTENLSTKQVLLDRGVVSPDQIARALAERFGLDYLDLSVFKVNFAVANTISAETARRYKAVPVELTEEGSILLAIADPANVLALDDLSILTGHNIKPAVASLADIEALIGQLTKLDSSIEEAISFEEEAEQLEVTDIHESADDAPVIKLTHALITQALDAKASDIHLEPDEQGMRVRYRIDGVLSDNTTLPPRMVKGIVSRIKVMADLDIATHRLPQDGRVTLKVDGRPVDIRVVTLPSAHGETVVMRLLDKERSVSLSSTGLQGDGLMRFTQAIRKPYGAVLVTGPTGSGKTSTLYAGLQLLNTPDKSIVTVEDPIEFQISGVTQIQVNPKTGISFAQGLRSILRADPDTIMVGEIRDRETARIAIESALTGHLVLTTLHTNDAPSAITRLIDMGVEPFLIASALDCVVAQRLVRLLCANCKRPTAIEAAALRASGFVVGEQETIEGFEALGCHRCGASGFKGRIGVFEVMRMSEEIRRMTLQRASADEIRTQARLEGMMTLREDGLEKIRQGLTSAEEVTRVIS